MAKTGQPRKTKQPLKIDRLPPIVHRAIAVLRNEHGLSWQEIEDLSALPFDQQWDDVINEDKNGNISVSVPQFAVHPGRGFVQWSTLAAPVAELFLEKRLGHSLLHRWWDIRVEQVSANVTRLSTQAKSIAKVFAKSAVKGDKEAVQNAARDILLGILAEDGTVDGRKSIAAGLIRLAEVQIKSNTNQLRERVVSVDERRVAQLEKDAEARRMKMDAETAKLTKKAAKGQVTPEDIDRLRERVFGMAPKAKVEANVPVA